MRTTIDLPDDLLDMARSLARSRRQTLSEVVADMIRRGLMPSEPARIVRSESGFPVLSVGGRVITAADVAALEEEEDEHLSSFIRHDADVDA
ncbi:antitoxin [uncultured Jatrophihabitans sp.]|uniref:antitoxin n=1 Tax=uncultured Jatrophihabitans sp. TaxID=1610747 RepID=UPI0035CC0EEF